MSPGLLPYTLVLLSLGVFVPAQSFIPSVIPLAVRSPYLNSWAIATEPSFPSTNTSAIFWFNPRWLGNSSTNQNVTVARLVSTMITPTRTIQVIEAGPVNMTVTFLSPIEPSDWVRQSLSFSYLAVEAEATDGKAHSVQVYSDIAAQWTSPIHTDGVNWTTMTPSDIVYHQFQLSQPTYLSEMLEFPSDGSYYYAMSRGENVTYKTCSDTVCRSNFTQYGTLANVENDINFRAINDNSPVFAMSIDLGDIISTQSSPVVWAVGYNQNPAIQYTVSNGEYQLLSPLFTNCRRCDFLSDFSDAESRAIAMDNHVQQAASQVTTDQGYYTLLSLSTRQAFSSMSITISPDSIGNDWSISDVMIFMKDMGFDGGVNSVDKMYGSFPNFLFFNASLGGPLLSPLLQTQFNNASRQNYAATELGQIFPTSVDPTWAADEAVDRMCDFV
ncbi:uncharacterized protein FIBRA_03326 [Fibroporia radiculosa]|uniref:Uncharacterized protein n=1 Tax=Fibroporia radiculosa TaxID=599839 RepID=J4HVX6_9APHY|nr:uncharacterized protein FIBRA_03326 [Fibroporia radiculosa]CCM01277.1 predicted protein [Fibroporia radiculosa]